MGATSSSATATSTSAKITDQITGLTRDMTAVDSAERRLRRRDRARGPDDPLNQVYLARTPTR